jgi:hypothetical protein
MNASQAISFTSFRQVSGICCHAIGSYHFRTRMAGLSSNLLSRPKRSSVSLLQASCKQSCSNIPNAQVNPDHQPNKPSNLGDPLSRAQFLNPHFPCIIELVDRHVAPPGKMFCSKNNFTRLCLADQLFRC